MSRGTTASLVVGVVNQDSRHNAENLIMHMALRCVLTKFQNFDQQPHISRLILYTRPTVPCMGCGLYDHFSSLNPVSCSVVDQ